MNNTIRILIGAIILLTALNLFNTWRSSKLEKEKNELVKAVNDLYVKLNENSKEEEIEVADYMAKLQRYADKLWFAGKNDNDSLVAFYVHEIEESMEIVADNEIMDEGVNVSQLMTIMGLPALENFESSIKRSAKDSFEIHYQNLITGCNNCHRLSKHGFIKIIKPENPAYDNQIY